MSKSHKLNSKDILLLMLYSPGKTGKENEEIRGRTRIVKMLFIFQKEYMKSFKADKIDFKPWNYGPWSEDIYTDIEFLKNLNFIEVGSSSSTDADVVAEEAEEFEKWEGALDMDASATEEYNQEVFALSDLGKGYVSERLYSDLSADQKKLLLKFKEKYNSLSLYAILQYVYKKYPDMTERSKILDKINP